MKRNKFSKKDYDQNDAIAREAVSKWFARHGMPLEIHADDVTVFKGDLIEPKSGTLVEVERKTKWVTKNWPYSTVHCVSRKRNMFKSGKCMLCIVSKNCSRVCFILPQILQKYIQDYRASSEFNSKDNTGREIFYDVPVHECKFDDVEIKNENPFF